MPRFYFNLRRAHLHLVDKHGENCATLAEALEHGVVAILSLVAEEGRFRNWTAWAVDIQDQDRHPAATLPFTLVLKADRRRKS
ncbi:DUF6894 family protein [Microvirga puerhi]|uniref:DUF6894 domain-containing protein n=1 Tax=Microvirga puerhi TaxID=2876078 RepID=A0ABS7VHR0_9HYPH|nr:hypothetical protein [Microvirga puerhi]MBZ6075043.1 hypothetical protein [Microvirga puerhi]